MTPTPASSTISVVLDASVVIAFCAKEPGNHPKAQAYLDTHARKGSRFFAPGVLVAETLYVFCKKLDSGALTAAEHALAVQSLEAFLTGVSPPPAGDRSLVTRAEQLRAGHSCRNSADAIYLALAEDLAKAGATELVTFDGGMEKKAKSLVPGATAVCLT
jgi:predicted nucleic acid-binding protein